ILAASAVAFAALALAACNKPADTDGKTAPAGQSALHNQQVATAPTNTVPPAPPPPDVTPPAPDETTGTPAGAGPVSGTITPADLAGKWIALVGRSESGSIVEAWHTPEALEFKQTGELIWTKRAGVAPNSYHVSLTGRSLEFNPAPTNVG